MFFRTVFTLCFGTRSLLAWSLLSELGWLACERRDSLVSVSAALRSQAHIRTGGSFPFPSFLFLLPPSPLPLPSFLYCFPLPPFFSSQFSPSPLLVSFFLFYLSLPPPLPSPLLFACSVNERKISPQFLGEIQRQLFPSHFEEVLKPSSDAIRFSESN